MNAPIDDSDSTEPVNEDDLMPLGDSEAALQDDPDIDSEFALYQDTDVAEDPLQPDEVAPEVRF